MTYFKSGSWNAICDVCGFKFKADQMKKRWDGLMTCEADFEHDHPQKYLKVREDKTSVPWVRNRPADVFVPVCTPDGRSAIPGLAIPGCVVPSYINAGNSLSLAELHPGMSAIPSIAIPGYVKPSYI